MTDETNISPVEDKRFVAPDPVPEPFEWYQAFKNGESIGEGPTPIPDDIRLESTEIRWSNPLTDKSFTPDPEPPSPEKTEEVNSEELIAYTPPISTPNKANMPWVDPSIPPEIPKNG